MIRYFNKCVGFAIFIAIILSSITLSLSEIILDESILLNEEIGQISEITAIGDLDHDGFEDIAAVVFYHDSFGYSHRLTILAGNADYRFEPKYSEILVMTTNVKTISNIGDINLDGIDDISISNHFFDMSRGVVHIMSSNDSMHYTESATLYGDAFAQFFGEYICSLGDWNDDDYGDFAISGPGGTDLSSVSNVKLFSGIDLSSPTDVFNTDYSHSLGEMLDDCDIDGDGLKELLFSEHSFVDLSNPFDDYHKLYFVQEFGDEMDYIDSIAYPGYDGLIHFIGDGEVKDEIYIHIADTIAEEYNICHFLKYEFLMGDGVFERNDIYFEFPYTIISWKKYENFCDINDDGFKELFTYINSSDDWLLIVDAHNDFIILDTLMIPEYDTTDRTIFSSDFNGDGNPELYSYRSMGRMEDQVLDRYFYYGESVSLNHKNPNNKSKNYVSVNCVEFTSRCKFEGNLVLYDISGKLIQNLEMIIEEGINRKTVRLPHSGIYLCTVKNPEFNNNISGKVISIK